MAPSDNGEETETEQSKTTDERFEDQRVTRNPEVTKHTNRLPPTTQVGKKRFEWQLRFEHPKWAVLRR